MMTPARVAHTLREIDPHPTECHLYEISQENGPNVKFHFDLEICMGEWSLGCADASILQAVLPFLNAYFSMVLELPITRSVYYRAIL